MSLWRFPGDSSAGHDESSTMARSDRLVEMQLESLNRSASEALTLYCLGDYANDVESTVIHFISHTKSADRKHV